MTVSSRFRIASQVLVLAFGSVSAAAAFAQDKGVFQVTDNDLAKWDLVLNNIRNLQPTC